MRNTTRWRTASSASWRVSQCKYSTERLVGVWSPCDPHPPRPHQRLIHVTSGHTQHITHVVPRTNGCLWPLYKSKLPSLRWAPVPRSHTCQVLELPQVQSQDKSQACIQPPAHKQQPPLPSDTQSRHPSCWIPGSLIRLCWVTPPGMFIVTLLSFISGRNNRKQEEWMKHVSGNMWVKSVTYCKLLDVYCSPTSLVSPAFIRVTRFQK